jgi:hypothetical protein
MPGKKWGLSATGQVACRRGGQKRSGGGKNVAGRSFFHIIFLPVKEPIVKNQ